MNHPRFIIIDDDPVNNFICVKTIQRVIPDPSIIAFTEAVHALEYLQSSAFNISGVDNVIILLDINMPLMSGWDFLSAYESLPGNIKRPLSIYMLSSSVNPEDMARAEASEYVMDYIMKPLPVDVINSIVNGS